MEAIAGSVRWARRPHHRALPSTQLPPGRAGSAHPSVGRRSRVVSFSPSNDRQQHPTGYFRDDAQEHTCRSRRGQVTSLREWRSRCWWTTSVNIAPPTTWCATRYRRERSSGRGGRRYRSAVGGVVKGKEGWRVQFGGEVGSVFFLEEWGSLGVTRPHSPLRERGDNFGM